jgi:hypothetical protein
MTRVPSKWNWNIVKIQTIYKLLRHNHKLRSTVKRRMYLELGPDIFDILSKNP